jgi:hypothetical protein
MLNLGALSHGMLSHGWRGDPGAGRAPAGPPHAAQRDAAEDGRTPAELSRAGRVPKTTTPATAPTSGSMLKNAPATSAGSRLCPSGPDPRRLTQTAVDQAWPQFSGYQHLS